MTALITHYGLTGHAKRFLEREPTLIKDFSDVFGCKLFENPIFGSDAPLIALVCCGDLKQRVYNTEIYNEYYDEDELWSAVFDFVKSKKVWREDPNAY